MRTLKTFAAGFLAFLLTLTPLAAAAQIPLLGAGQQRSSAAASQTSVWSVAASTAQANGSTFSTTLVANDTVVNASTWPGSTDISTFAFPSNQSGKWFWQVKVNAVQSESRFGIASGARASFIGNWGGAQDNLAMRKDGIFYGSTGQTGVNIVTGDVVDHIVDLATGQVAWSTDGITWWGAGGVTTSTLAEIIAGTGGWITSPVFDNRVRYPAVSGVPMGTMQLLAGSNITRSPPTGFTVIP